MQASEPLAVLQFSLLNQLFGIPLNTIQRVLHFVKLQPIPGMPAHVKGALNLHGQKILVVDLGEQLGTVKNPVYYTNTPIIICQQAHQRIGLIVSEVLGIEYVEGEKLQMDKLFEKEKIPFLEADFSTAGGDTLLLNIEKIFEANQ